jgi:hypothetical protein
MKRETLLKTIVTSNAITIKRTTSYCTEYLGKINLDVHRGMFVVQVLATLCCSLLSRCSKSLI